MSYFSSSRDNSPVPLLSEHRASVSLQNLSPRGASSSRATPSPPPSFYRDLNSNASTTNDRPYNGPALSPSPSFSPSRTKDRSTRRIQFSAPPPPIASSVFLSPRESYGGSGGGGGSRSPGSGNARSRSARGGVADGASGRGRSSESRSGRAGGGGSGLVGMDPLLVLERRERAIQLELQVLLDAQSAGLVQGFGGERDGGSDAGSSTPTTRSLHNRDTRGVVPVRQPKKKVLSLRGARRGLLRDMGELVQVKNEEASILESEIERRNEVLSRVAEWEKRIEGVREQLSSYSGAGGSDTGEGEGGGEEAMEMAELRTEEKAVDNEIREMEDRLAAMHARKRWLGERIREGVNRREAKLSSYRGALREVEGEVKEFLRRPPVQASVVMGGEEGFTSLPTGRRTLGLAREWWGKEVGALTNKREEVEKERTALEDGARIWAESIDTVVGFEDELRRQMSAGDAGDKEMLRGQIGRMGEVIRGLEGKMGVVEGKGWNLLICAVGAELEAFREGEGILRSALGMVEPEVPVRPTLHTDTRTNGKGPDGFAGGDSGGGQESLLDGEVEQEEQRDDDGRNSHGHGEDDDTDSILNELNTGAGMDGSREMRARGMRTRTSFGSEVESDEGPNLAELMVDVDRR